METTERLQRVLAARGVGSRRKAEALIREGRVKVDGEVVTELGVRVDPLAARIEVDGRSLRPQRMRYLLLNKPSGYMTTTSDERGRRTVLDLVSVPERVYPVGRLDRETDGLLLLTNDGEVANRVMHPRYGLAKEYNILTAGRPPERLLERVRRGVTVDGKRVTPEAFRILRETHNGVILTMTIHEGMNRVVRKMMEEAGIPVVRLRRVRIGPLSLAGIPLGTYRDLTPGELGSLLEALRLQEAEPEPAAGERAVQ
ncbi:MAG TPA: pseudouridine synthase, partial [Thermomicrobiales bacterium]|nr:pseudouridine synthase [Thermomicrobiales bacterium]